MSKKVNEKNKQTENAIEKIDVPQAETPNVDVELGEEFVMQNKICKENSAFNQNNDIYSLNKNEDTVEERLLADETDGVTDNVENLISNIVVTDKSLTNVNSDYKKNQNEKNEQRRRLRVIKTSRNIFRSIDVLFSTSQNSCPYVTKSFRNEIDTRIDIIYDDTDTKTCVMDFYEKSNSELGSPAVFLIHGGGFSAGDKKFRRGLAEFFVLNGFKVFVVNYGLAPDCAFPLPVKQLVNACNMIYDRANEFGIDRERVLFAGDSAGGYFAAMLGVIWSNSEFNKKFDCNLKLRPDGLLLNCGLYDLQTVLNTKYILDIDEGVFLSFTGISKKEFDTYAHKEICMPLEFVTEKFPPTFFAYSPKDLFCKGQGEALKSRLDTCGVYYESYSARHSTSNHCYPLNWRGEDAVAANELMISFAKRLVNNRIKLD